MLWIARRAVRGDVIKGRFLRRQMPFNTRFLKRTPTFYISFVLFRDYSTKYESYFSAIGGDSPQPPPDLTPQQVTAILRTNEKRLTSSQKLIKLIECNQLASNHPIEDRIRVSKLNLTDDEESMKKQENEQKPMLLAVFDGHGGGLCADVISRRLFHYIAIALLPDALDTITKNPIESVVNDLIQLPPAENNSTSIMYDDRALAIIKQHIDQQETNYLVNYAIKLHENPVKNVDEAIKQAFVQCDMDLSDEIEKALMSSKKSNVLLHYYFSLAVSGCCVTLAYINQDRCYLASTGDCKAVFAVEEAESSAGFRTIDLTHEHNSDNIAEIKRLQRSHPPSEANNLIKNERLLSHLMPLRAFGDFCYKWQLEKIKRVGLTRAFGSHIIPPYYYTPPYLIAEPEVSRFNLIENSTSKGQKYIALATDGLWEQYENPRYAMEQLIKHSSSSEINSLNTEKEEKRSITFEAGTLLSTIRDRLRTKYASYHRPTSDEVFLTANETHGSAGSGYAVGEEHAMDGNLATHMLRMTLATTPNIDCHIDQYELRKQMHQRLVTFLTLPEHSVRNFRDDISIIVLKME